MKIARGNTRMGTWAFVRVATCISEYARAVARSPSLVLNKARPSSPKPATLAKEASRPATLAGYPSAAAVAEPLGCRSSSTTSVANDVHASVVLIESSVCHIALAIARSALQPELSMCTSGVTSSSRLTIMLSTTGVCHEEPLRSIRQDLMLNETLPWRKARCLEDGTAQPERYSLCAFDSAAI